MATTAKLALSFIAAAQTQNLVTHDEAIRALDILVQIGVLDRHLASPPSSPAAGDRYIVAAGGSTGAGADRGERCRLRPFWATVSRGGSGRACQPFDAELTAIAEGAWSANRVPYLRGSGPAAVKRKRHADRLPLRPRDRFAHPFRCTIPEAVSALELLPNLANVTVIVGLAEPLEPRLHFGERGVDEPQRDLFRA